MSVSVEINDIVLELGAVRQRPLGEAGERPIAA